MVSWRTAEHTFGIGSGAIAVIGKIIQGRPNEFLTGVKGVDDFMHYNLDSIFGAAAIVYVLNMGISSARVGKDSSLIAFLWCAVSLIQIELYDDPAEFKQGVDYVDLYGGLAAMGLYVGLAKLSGDKA